MAPRRDVPMRFQEKRSKKYSQGETFPKPSPAETSSIPLEMEKAQNFLQQEDPYLQGSCKQKAEVFEGYLQKIEELRHRGDITLDANSKETLRDCVELQRLHEKYHDWMQGPMRFSTGLPLRKDYPQRLSPYYRQLPTACKEEGKLPSTYTSLVPRLKEVAHPPFFAFADFKDEPNWDAFFSQPGAEDCLNNWRHFRYHANSWGCSEKGGSKSLSEFQILKNADNPTGINHARDENLTYENLLDKDWTSIARTQQKLATVAQYDSTGNYGFAVSRGVRRAIIQKVLNSIRNDENREVNTPWRRVTFPQSVKRFQHIHYHPWVLPRREAARSFGDKEWNRNIEFEPSKWIFWYNEWIQQAKYISAWTRQSYNKRHWSNFKQIALPVNFCGPYSFKDKCIYDDYWLKIGSRLITLQANLERMVVQRPRWLLERVVQDIKLGEGGEDPDKEVVPRVEFDLVDKNPDKYQLIDEMDMTWLQFLCHPPTTKALSCLSSSKLEDALTILLNHRLQSLFNDPMYNPFWLTDITSGAAKPSYRPREISLEHLLPMINSGGRDIKQKEFRQDDSTVVITEYQTASHIESTGAPIPNSLYQFSLKEVKIYCKRLAEMGFIAFKCPQRPGKFDQTWWSGKGTLYYYPDDNYKHIGGSVAPVPAGIDPSTKHSLGKHPNADENPARYPEERIRWRYHNEAAFNLENQRQKKLYVDTMLERNREAQGDWPYSKEAYEEEFLPEVFWKQGPVFADKSVESLRETPAWEDILDYRTVVAKDVGLSFKTINFLRNLAYRMGHTIRHYRTLQQRVSASSSLARSHLHVALHEWKLHVENTDIHDMSDTAVSVKLGKPHDIVQRANTGESNENGESTTVVFKKIRDGIIDDIVANRVMLYPSRRTLYTDKHRFMGEFYERANIWSWGSEPIRQRHSLYRRERYFDMRRWPLNRQPDENMRTAIRNRADEDPTIQPVSAFYKHSIKVGPVPLVPAQSDIISKLITWLGDPDKQVVAEQLIHNLSKEVVKIVKNTDEAFGPDWEFTVTPPGTTISDRSSQTTSTIADSKSSRRPRPVIRPTQKFIPGPAVFPMGDTFLQQIKISQDLERILDPKPQGIVPSFFNFFKGWIAPHEKIPLLPDIDLSKIPSTSRLNLKRKVNTAFVTADGRSTKRKCSQVFSKSNNEGGGGPLNSSLRNDGSGTDGNSSDVLDFVHVLPGRSRTSGPEKQKDGTLKIKVEVDLEDVMKMDISRNKNKRGTHKLGSQPIVSYRYSHNPFMNSKTSTKFGRSNTEWPVIKRPYEVIGQSKTAGTAPSTVP